MLHFGTLFKKSHSYLVSGSNKLSLTKIIKKFMNRFKVYYYNFRNDKKIVILAQYTKFIYIAINVRYEQF